MKTNAQDMPAERNTGIDLFRGLLVLGVILGHFSELTCRDSFFTWFGFGFRMPVFIGLTGYLFHLERARLMPAWVLFRKYYRRLILPWLVACIVHLTIVGQIDWHTPLAIIIRPPFHLWFVPVMIAFIFVARFSRLDPPTMLLIALPFSIAAMYLFGVGHGIEQYHWLVPDRRYFIYPIYFFYGLWVARRTPDTSRPYAAVLLASIGLLWWSRLYLENAPAAEVAAELILSMPLIALLPLLRRVPLKLPPLASVGRDSLFFYLWHPLVLGLWASSGVSGLPMLWLSMISLAMARWAIARMPHMPDLLGIQPKPRPVYPPSGIARYAKSPENAP